MPISCPGRTAVLYERDRPFLDRVGPCGRGSVPRRRRRARADRRPARRGSRPRRDPSRAHAPRRPLRARRRGHGQAERRRTHDRRRARASLRRRARPRARSERRTSGSTRSTRSPAGVAWPTVELKPLSACDPLPNGSGPGRRAHAARARRRGRRGSGPEDPLGTPRARGAAAGRGFEGHRGPALLAETRGCAVRSTPATTRPT